MKYPELYIDPFDPPAQTPENFIEKNKSIPKNKPKNYMNSEWINVKDKLPKKFEIVEVQSCCHGSFIGYIYKQQWFYKSGLPVGFVDHTDDWRYVESNE
jgi:hypothetical protein